MESRLIEGPIMQQPKNSFIRLAWNELKLERSASFLIKPNNSLNIFFLNRSLYIIEQAPRHRSAVKRNGVMKTSDLNSFRVSITFLDRLHSIEHIVNLCFLDDCCERCIHRQLLLPLIPSLN